MEFDFDIWKEMKVETASIDSMNIPLYYHYGGPRNVGEDGEGGGLSKCGLRSTDVKFMGQISCAMCPCVN